MTQGEKDILLKDLCARLPYGVKVQTGPRRDETDYSKVIYDNVETLDFIMMSIMFEDNIEEYKPYLFPLSSMTEEQKIEEYKLMNSNLYTSTVELPDFYDKNHFDYRGLIPMGLAIDASGKNIY